jgi:hypothetical protein
MAVVFPDVGKEVALAVLFDAGRNPKIKLFKNNLNPVVATVLTDLTEADFSGYADIDLSAASAAAIDGTDRGFRELDANTFTHNGGATTNSVYGWYVVLDDPSPAAELFMIERFSAPQLMGSVGDQIVFDLTIFDELGT